MLSSTSSRSKPTTADVELVLDLRRSVRLNSSFSPCSLSFPLPACVCLWDSVSLRSRGGEGTADATGTPTLQLLTPVKPLLPTALSITSEALLITSEGSVAWRRILSARTARRDLGPMLNISRSRIASSRYPPGLRTRFDSETMLL